MRLTCPVCGPRDRREYFYYGSSDYLARPAEDAPAEVWDRHLHLRDNPAGETRDLWYHEMGCSTWLEVTRNTVTHAVLAVRMVAEGGGGGASGGGISQQKKPARRGTGGGR